MQTYETTPEVIRISFCIEGQAVYSKLKDIKQILNVLCSLLTTLSVSHTRPIQHLLIG
jgi:hypothetical protein